MVDQLIASIERNGNKLHHDDPSWLYAVDQEGISIWGRWNTYTIANGFDSVSMNSFNYYACGLIVSNMELDGNAWNYEASIP